MTANLRASIPPLLGCLLAGIGASQTTWYVDVAGTPPGSGTPGDPYTSLQHAIDQPATLSGDRLLVLPGTYLETVSYGGKTLLVESSEGPAATVIDAAGAGTVVTFTGGEGAGTTLRGFTLRGGTGTMTPGGLRGGGVLCQTAQVLLENCRIEHCSAQIGGGIDAASSELVLAGCTITDIPCGGGIHADAMPRLELQGCVLQRIEPADTCWVGGELGALRASASTVVLAGCLFADNHARFFEVDPSLASGASLQDCVTTIDDCHFADHGISPDHPFDFGGAVSVSGGTLVLRTSSFTDNAAETRGGALVLRGVDAAIEDGHFADNRSFDHYWGGALYVSPLAAGVLEVRRTSFERNQGGDGGAVYLGAGTALFEDCHFVDNVALGLYSESGAGGALFLAPPASASLLRCALLGNRARGNDFLNPQGGRGGAVAGAASLLRCTLALNEAQAVITPAEGGAAFGAALDSCIAWSNLPDQLAGGALADWSAVEGGWPGTGNLDADPSFWDLDGRDLQLLPGSPCIDAGNPGLELDEDGTPVEMGAFAFDDHHCGTPRAYCEAKVNSQGCVPSISWNGTPEIGRADDFHVLASGVINKQNGILLWGRAPASAPFFGGTRCVAPPIVRTPIQSSGGAQVGIDCSGSFAFHFSEAYLATAMVAAFDALYAQFWYRDPQDATGVGLTDALRFRVCGEVDG